MTINERLLAVTKLLFPTGRAFRISNNSVKEKIEKGIIESEVRAHNDLLSILDTILPDNDNFTAEDATRWEERLGMIVNDQVALSDRKLAIKRKMNHPGDIIARQSRDYIESQLQLAGFDVYVHENLNEQYPNIIFGASISGIAVHSTDTQHMQTGMVHGSPYLWGDVVANSIDWEIDQYFDIGSNLKCTFIICASTIGTFANVQNERREELRQLILKLKPTQTIAYLGINYI